VRVQDWQTDRKRKRGSKRDRKIKRHIYLQTSQTDRQTGTKNEREREKQLSR